MKRIHSHPVYILESVSRYLILLLLPVLRALITTLLYYHEGGFTAWLSGAWFDLLIVAVILALSIYQWLSFTFYYDQHGIYIYRGILIRQVRYIAFINLTAVSITIPWYYLPFHAVRLKADTDGGSPLSSDFSITIQKSIAERMIQMSRIMLISNKQIKQYYIPGNFYMALFSLLTSNSITGVLYVAAAVSKFGDIFGQEIQDEIVNSFTRIASLLAFGLPPAAAILAYTILICWLLSFLINLMQHLRFQSARQSQLLEICSGLFTQKKFFIAVHRINTLMIRQSLLTKLFGFSSAFIQCTGYGKEQNELSVILPAGEERDMMFNLSVLLPEIPLAKRSIRPKLVNLSRFLIPPLTLIACVVAAGFICVRYLFPNFRTTVMWMFVFFLIPCVWWLTVKTFAFFYTGIGVNDNVVTLYYTRGYRVMVCSIPKHKLSKISISQTLFQISTKCCDVTFFPYGEKQGRHKVLNLHLPEVRQLLQLDDADLGIESWDRFTLWK